HPTQDTVLLYASGLPLLPAGSSYQVRLAFDEDREQAGPSFRPDGHGALALAIRLGRAAERLHAVRVLLEPAAEPVPAGARARRLAASADTPVPGSGGTGPAST